MTWMLTATGAEVNLRFIAAETISVLDIAHHLSQLNRYTGACARPYSVAEHSLLVSDILERQLHINDPRVLMAGLLHDAHEAYTADLSQPMKQLIGPAWTMEEDRIERAVRARFGLGEVSPQAWQHVKWADLTALSTEREQLLPPGQTRWPVTGTHPPLPRADCDLASRTELSWDDWRQIFLDRYAELHYAATHHTEETPS